MGNHPVKSLHMVLLCSSRVITKQNISFSIAAQQCSGGAISSTSARASNISWRLLLVDRSPLRTRTICPLAVALDAGRYLVMRFLSKPGND